MSKYVKKNDISAQDQYFSDYLSELGQLAK